MLADEGVLFVMKNRKERSRMREQLIQPGAGSAIVMHPRAAPVIFALALRTAGTIKGRAPRGALPWNSAQLTDRT